MQESKLIITIKDKNCEVEISLKGDITFNVHPTPAQRLANQCMEFAENMRQLNATRS